jgi:hypothetical protein
MNEQEPSYEEMISAFEASTADLREELAQRSVEEIAYDDCVLGYMRKGKKFKIALRKANQKFPHEALESNQLEEIEQHYVAILRMMVVDEQQARVEAMDAEQRRIEARIAELEQQILDERAKKEQSPE